MMGQDPFRAAGPSLRAMQASRDAAEPPAEPAPVAVEAPEPAVVSESASEPVPVVEAPTAPPDGFDPDWPVNRLERWAKGDDAKTDAVLAAEAAKDKPRQSLWTRLGRTYGR